MWFHGGGSPPLFGPTSDGVAARTALCFGGNGPGSALLPDSHPGRPHGGGAGAAADLSLDGPGRYDGGGTGGSRGVTDSFFAAGGPGGGGAAAGLEKCPVFQLRKTPASLRGHGPVFRLQNHFYRVRTNTKGYRKPRAIRPGAFSFLLVREDRRHKYFS